MNNMKFSTLAIIPARGGSTRLKNKNIFPLGDKPLICHTIETVSKTNLFDKIVVSTDSREIAEVASQYDEVSIHDRPASLATERATVVSAILEYLKKDSPRFDVVSYFLPTCPFRSVEDVKEGLGFLNSADSVISTCYYDSPIQLAMIEGDQGHVYPVFDNLKSGLTNSRFIQKYVRPNGAFYMSKWDLILESGAFFNGKIKQVRMPKERSVDIDTYEDIVYAEALLKRDSQ